MARFILSEMITRARRLSRTTSNAVTDQEVGDLINEGLREFGKEVHGLWSRDYLTLVPKFDGRTNWYYYIASDSASASVAVTATDFTAATGSTVAGYMTTALQALAGNWATASIVWSNTDWAFVAVVPSSTYVEVAAPSLDTVIDGTPYFWGTEATQTTASFLGSFPQDCTVEASLPTGFINMEWAEWNGSPISPAPPRLFTSPALQGTDPAYYAVIGKNIRIFASPTVQKKFEVWFKKLPTEFGDASASGSFTAECPLDLEYELAPMYYAASMLAEENFEGNIADRYRAKFLLQCYKYTQQYNNQNPGMFPRVSGVPQPKVDPTTR